MDGFLQSAFVYLAAAVVAVPLAQRLGLGSVLGYLIAGIIIGPFALGLVGASGDVMHFAEFGVVMMLFVIGLELEPARLWRLRGPILGLGGLQVAVTSALIAGGAIALGLEWRAALAVGMILSLSSTAIVLQTLQERSLLRGEGGQSAFSVLLFQDIAVIPMLALLPLLASGAGSDHGAHGHDAAHGASALAALPPWAQTAAVLGAVAFVVLAGRYALGPALTVLARTRLRELFTAAALLLVVGIALLMELVGLSPALGAFLAGVVLANSPYRHELESDIEPFKGLLLGLFFISVGASIDFPLIAAQPLVVLGLVVGLVTLKGLVLFGLARAFRLGLGSSLLVAFALPQMGEFAFVLFSFAVGAGVLTAAVTSPLVAVVAISMALTPLLMLVNERFVQPRLAAPAPPAREPDAVDERAPVLIAGFGSFGSTVGRLLRANGVRTTVLDFDADRVALLRSLGLDVHYGDAQRHDLLHAAGAAEAQLLVVALDDPAKTIELVKTVRRLYPQLAIYARAFDWPDAYDLVEAGATGVYREALDSALRLGTDVLRRSGLRAHQAHRAAQTFLRHDEETLRTLGGRNQDRASYLLRARERIEELERILQADRVRPTVERDGAWDAETLRREFGGPRGTPDETT